MEGRELPILMSSIMVQAIIAKRKSMTRREVKPQPYDRQATIRQLPDGDFLLENWPEAPRMMLNFGRCERIKSTYQPGDVLYVRESYYQRGNWREIPGVKTKGGRTKWEFVPADENITFEAPAEYRKGRHHKDPHIIAWHKRLGRFMSRKYARIWLEVTSVRAERLQDISEEDAIAEGLIKGRNVSSKILGNYMYRLTTSDDWVESAIDAFRDLWFSVYGIGENSWTANPWVWVYSFKTLSIAGSH